MVVLAYMANWAFDHPVGNLPSNTYRAGHNALGAALGYVDNQALQVVPTDSQMTEIGNVVRHLIKIGAIERVRNAAHGRAAEYILHRRPVERQPP